MFFCFPKGPETSGSSRSFSGGVRGPYGVYQKNMFKKDGVNRQKFDSSLSALGNFF